MSNIIKDLRAVAVEADKNFPGNADALPHICTRAADEIERLREDRQGLEIDLSAATQRIEELEGKIANEKRIIFDESCEWFKDKHLVTNEQIDEAWKWTSDPELRPFSRKGAELALKEFGIKRCEHLQGSQINGELVGTCPDCNGYGWVIGGEDE